MGNTLYLECNAGVSGDMMVAMLLDLGADQEVLRRTLESLPVGGFEIKMDKVKKSGLLCQDFDVILEQDNHDHDMEYLHGNWEEHDHHEHNHHHGHEHHHEHHHDHDHNHNHNHNHHHEHRGPKDILEIALKSQMSDRGKGYLKDILQVLSEAEAKAHGTSIDQVHFHEVGAIDSIVDLIAVSVCLDNLDIDRVFVPKLWEGTGTVRCQHGILPIPVPAVANIIQKHQIPLEIMDIQGEFVTPTGAAIVGAIATDYSLPKNFTVRKIGLGAGKREYKRASILRGMLIDVTEETNGSEQTEIVKLESNIDDITGENLGFVMELLLNAGARDVFYTPIYMKKNRPAYLLSVISHSSKVSLLEDIIFKNTTTIGIRKIPVQRSVLPREIQSVDTRFGKVDVKVCQIQGEKRYYPEYESVAAICRKQGLSYQQVYHEVIRFCENE